MLVLVGSYLLTYASDDVSVIFNLGGGLFSPFLSYIMPILWARSFDNKRHMLSKKSILVHVLDYSTIAFGLVVGVIANYYGFMEAIHGDIQ